MITIYSCIGIMSRFGASARSVIRSQLVTPCRATRPAYRCYASVSAKPQVLFLDDIKLAKDEFADFQSAAEVHVRLAPSRLWLGLTDVFIAHGQQVP